MTKNFKILILSISILSEIVKTFNLTFLLETGKTVSKRPSSFGVFFAGLIFNSSKRIVVGNLRLVTGPVTVIVYSGPNEVFLKKIQENIFGRKIYADISHEISINSSDTYKY